MTRADSHLVEPLERRQLLSAGQLDLSFGQRGIAVLDVPGIAMSGAAVATLPNGRILVGGLVARGAVNTLGLARFLRNGKLDTSFGGRNGDPPGVVITNVQCMGTNRIEVLSNGRIIAYNQSQVTRFNAGGKLDTTFQRGHFKRMGYAMYALDVDDQADGKLVVAASYRPAEEFDGLFTVVRLNEDGTVDATWGASGMFTYDSPAHGSAMSVRVLEDGSIIAAGQLNFGYPDEITEYTRQDMISLKLDEQGNLDASYGQAGAQISSSRFFAGASVSGFISSDGSATLLADSQSSSSFHRSTPAGLDDSVFGNTDGWTSVSAGDRSIASIAVQPDGAVVYVGAVHDWPDYIAPAEAYIGRLTPAGEPDLAFGDAGIKAFDFGGSGAAFSTVKLTVDGRIIASTNVGGKIHIARFWADEGPVGELSISNLKQEGSEAHQFKVNFRDDGELVVGSIEAGDLRVIGPDGTPLPVLAVEYNVRNMTACTVTFSLAAPLGSWSDADNGVYQVQLLPDSISDSAGHLAAGRNIGSFRIDIPTTPR